MATLALPVMAQEAYPSKPIHFVMPFPPSGSPVLGSSLQYVYTGKLAEREIFLKKQLDEAWAARNAEEVEKVKKQLVNERVRIEEEREAEKDGVRRRK